MNKQIDITGAELQTERMILRPWKETDLSDFYEYAKVDGVGQMAGWNPHKSIDESKIILGHFIDGKHVFALEYQGKVIGSLGVEEYKESAYPELSNLQGREIGYVLSKDYWGQGLMPEAVRAVIRWLFTSVELDFVLIGHFNRNNQSRRVIEKCGLQKIKSITIQTKMGTTEECTDYILYNR